MARVMNVQTHSAGYGAFFEPILAPPSGHKFELLELAIWGDASGGIKYYPTLDRGSFPYLLDEAVTVVDQLAVRFSFGAQLIEYGDTLQMFALAGSGNWAAIMTYIDVDT